MLLEDGTLPGPKSGFLSNTLEMSQEETHVLMRQKT